MTQVSARLTRGDIVELVNLTGCDERCDERSPGSITLATLPEGFYGRTCNVYSAFAKWERLRNKVPALCLIFHINMCDEVCQVRLVSPGRVYRPNFEWERFFGVRSREHFETDRVGEQVLVLFPNKPRRFDINEIISERWKQMSGGVLMRESDYLRLFQEATKELKIRLGSILFKGKDLTDVVTPEEVREILTRCLVSGILSLNQHKKLSEHFVKHRLVPADEPITGYLCKHMHQTLTPAQSAVVNDMRDVVLDLVNSVLDPVLPIPVVLPVPLVLHSRNKSRCSLL